jgi:predicted RNA-binding protein with PUA-like domain
MPKRAWLMKSEPCVYSIEDLARDRTTSWDSVRNYQARNFMRDEMRVGDDVLFYHSNAEPAGVAGLARVCSAGHPDETAFDPKSKYYDPDSTRDQPTWYRVDVEFVEAFVQVLPLAVLKANPALRDMKVVQRGMRLSVQPVTAAEWKEVLRMRSKLRR